MHHFHLVAIIIGLMIIFFSFFERKIQEGPVSEPLLAMLTGAITGPYVLDLLDPAQWGDAFEILHISCAATLAMALMATALRLPPDYLRRHWRTLVVLLTVVMGMAVVLGALGFRLFTGSSWLQAFLLAAIIAPTDPVIATVIVSGPVAEKFLPDRLRHTISMESGANDGLALAYVMLPLLLLQHPAGEAWSEWLTTVILWESLSTIISGAIMGLLAGKLLEHLNERGLVTSKAFLGFSVALALVAMAGFDIILDNGVIAVFAAGLGLNQVIKGEGGLRQERVQDAVERLFTIPIFFLFGVMLPWSEWARLGWVAAALPMVVLLLRRLPALFLSQSVLQTLHTRKDLWFAGWFGPVGVAAMFYAVLAVEQLGDSIYWTLPSLIIFSSTVLHGVTSGPFIRWYHQKTEG